MLFLTFFFVGIRIHNSLDSSADVVYANDAHEELNKIHQKNDFFHEKNNGKNSREEVISSNPGVYDSENGDVVYAQLDSAIKEYGYGFFVW